MGSKSYTLSLGWRGRRKLEMEDQPEHTAPEGEIQDIRVWVSKVELGVGRGGTSSSGS